MRSGSTSPVARLAPGERLATMASLLHRVRDGAAQVTELIHASGIGPEEWVRYAATCAPTCAPIVPCLLAHDLAFMRHGENLVMVLRDDVPVRMFIKDIGEEVAVMGSQPLPAEVERIRIDVSDDIKALALHTDVFDAFPRFLAAIPAEDNTRPMVDLADQAESLVFAGTLTNPIGRR